VELELRKRFEILED